MYCVDVYFKSLGDHICSTIHAEGTDKEANEGMVINFISQQALRLPSPFLSFGRGCNSRFSGNVDVNDLPSEKTF